MHPIIYGGSGSRIVTVVVMTMVAVMTIVAVMAPLDSKGKLWCTKDTSTVGVEGGG